MSDLYQYSEQDLDDFLKLAKECALEAGDVVQKGFEKEETNIEMKGTWDMVTETDKASEELIMNKIKNRYPTHQFVAEEEVSQGKADEVIPTNAPTWCIDPLDGTLNFVNRVAHVSISIGLVINKTPVVGVVLNPITHDLFFCRQNSGAFYARGDSNQAVFSNAHPTALHLSPAPSLSRALVATGCPSQLSGRELTLFLSHMNVLITNARSWRRSGSAALDLCNVAAGKLEMYCEQGGHAWDFAAGAAMLREVGAVLKNRRGGNWDLCGRELLCGRREVVEEYVEKMKGAWELFDQTKE